MKSLLQFVVLILMANTVWAAKTELTVAAAEPVAETSYIDVSAHQHIAYQSSIVDAKKPTLILLPGIFRGLNLSDSFIQLLIQKNINFVSFNFSTQPASVATYAPGEKTYFDGGKNLTSKDLANEVEILVDTLKIKKPLVVSLSYSGSVVEFLNAEKYPVVVDTSPIGRFEESDADAAKAFEAWAAWARIWFGDDYVQSQKDLAFRNYWRKTAVAYSGSDKRLASNENIERMTDGYVAMAKAVEKYDMREQNFETSPRRLFVFGQNEEALRKSIQLEAVEKYKKVTGLAAQPIIIQGAGHIVTSAPPEGQPEMYAQILEAVLNKMAELK